MSNINKWESVRVSHLSMFLLTIINISLGIWRVGLQRKRYIQNYFRSSRWRFVDHSSGVWNAFFVFWAVLQCRGWRPETGEERSRVQHGLSCQLPSIIPSPSHLSPRSIISVLWGPGYSTDLIGSSITINTIIKFSSFWGLLWLVQSAYIYTFSNSA